MGGAWVFPGGSTHRHDGDELRTARRELREEAGIALAADAELVRYSRWITPAQVKVRFDTHFFVARAPEGAEARVDGAECVGARWIRPREALDAGERGELMLVFPTIKHLEQLAEHGSVADAVDTARTRKVMPVEPRVEVPRSLGEAFALISSAPHRPVAGGTDLMVQIAGELAPPPDRVVDLWRLDELRGIGLDGGVLTLGALTTSRRSGARSCAASTYRRWSMPRRRSAPRRSRTAARSAATSPTRLPPGIRCRCSSRPTRRS